MRFQSNKYTKLVAAMVAIFVVGAVFLSDDGMSTPMADTVVLTPVDVPEGLEIATFGSGCFWCMEAAFQQTPGVVDATSGYAGGTETNPTYEQVYTMQTSHREAVQVTFDPQLITYEEVLQVFWRGIDPTDGEGQFVDRGFSYTAAVFYHNAAQEEEAQKSISELAQTDRFDGAELVTPILPFTSYYLAEEYHQDFFLKSPDRYNQYESGSGREEYKQFVWNEILKEQE